MKNGIKYDQDKPDLALLPFSALEDVARVMMFGASKYGKNNWRQGLSTSRLAAAALRHLGSWLEGEDNDNESNLPHLAHCATNIIFLLWTIKNKPQLDDRS